MGLLNQKGIEMNLQGNGEGATIMIRRGGFSLFRRTLAKVVISPGINGAPACIRAVSLRNAKDVALLEGLLDTCVNLVAVLEPQPQNQRAG